jgi:hypothetical protein
MTRNRGAGISIIAGADIHAYIRVHRLQKQSISKEINWAEHEYMNICPPNYRYSGATDQEEA